MLHSCALEQGSEDCLPGDTPATPGVYVTSSCRWRKGSRMETVTDIAIQECFVIHVLDNHLPAVQCSQALTPLPETLRTSLHRYLLALLKPQFRRKRYGRFRPESAVLQAYQQMLASLRRHGKVEAPDFLAASQAIATTSFRRDAAVAAEWLPSPSRHHHTRGSVGGTVAGYRPTACTRAVALPHQGRFGIRSAAADTTVWHGRRADDFNGT